jgi:hypothetical protein
MWMTRARSVLSAALLGAAATLGSIGPAQAAVYTGSWDPAYGSIFPSLGWQASAVFDVPDACEASDGFKLITGPCAGFDVLSAQVRLYDIAAPGTILGTYALDTNVPITGITIAGGDLAGVDSSFFGSFVPLLPIAGGGEYSFSLILFGGTKAQLIYAKPAGTSPTCSNPLTPVLGASCGVSANAATGVFAPVPEPETYALMLAGLGAIVFTARRRRVGRS